MLSKDEAIAFARKHMQDESAPVWATESGAFVDVFSSLAQQPRYLEQPLPDQAAADLPVWGIEFKISVEICGPSGGKCETRDGLTTVFINGATGEFITSTTYAPSPGEPLPSPSAN